MERKKYPIGSEFYELYEEIGQGVSAAVYRAICLPTSEIVAIKIIDFEKHNSDLSKISREAQTMILVDHPNVLRAYCSFVSDHTLWVVMPYMDGGSCLHVLKAAYPDGFGEVVIATILREVLKGLEYLHQHGHIHRDVKAGNILVDVRGSIKLGDFGVSACLFDSGDRQRVRNTFVGTPCWMAPEVMEQLNGYDFKADIWSFGITAMELAHGHAPFSKYPPMKVLLMTLQNAPPGLDYERDKKFSKSFKQMIAMCLVKDPSKRPTARKLSKHSFFKQARSNDYFARTILEGLPALGDRIRDLKRKDEDMLAQKKMPDGEKEEISQNEYKRGLSGWNFNIEDMKAQASLIQDAEEDIPDKDEGGSSSSLSGLDVQEKKIQCQSSINSQEDGDLMQNRPDTPPSLDLSANCLRGRWDRSEDDLSVAGSTSSCEHYNGHDDSQRHVDHIETDCNGKHEQDTTGRHLEGMNIRSPRTRESSSVTNLPGLSLPPIEESDSQTNVQNMPSCNGAVVPQAVDDAGTETVGRASKLSASNSEDLEEKLKGPVVQQRGRFKVTSEKAELEKASPSPMLQKSHSLQVISQPPIVSPPSDGTSSNLFSALHYLLQTNIAQRDSLLYLMKQLGPGDATSATNGYPTAGNIPSAMTEKSMMISLEKEWHQGGALLPSELEAANEREKELVQELNDLQWRLITTQEELQRFKIKNAQV